VLLRNPQRPGHLRAVAALLLGKLWVNGALDLPRLLHELRARARRGLLEPGVSGNAMTRPPSGFLGA
jgi:hypothetical protein